MPLLCLDGSIPDDDIAAWQAGPVHLRVALTCAQVRAMFAGPCLLRGIALLALTPVQLARLFPAPAPRRNARRLRWFARRLQGERVRAALATASWHQLRAAALHDGEETQIRAAFASVLRPMRGRRSTKA